MEELVDEGLARNIGLRYACHGDLPCCTGLMLHSNCPGVLLLDVLQHAKYDPQVLQIELHPYLTQEALIDLCKVHDIAVTAYSSFGPQSYIELEGDKGALPLLERDTICGIASTHEKSRYSLGPPVVYKGLTAMCSPCTSTVEMGHPAWNSCHPQEQRS